MMLKKQKGYTLLSLPSVLIGSALVAYITFQQFDAFKSEAKALQAENARTELVNLIDGNMACYNDERSWCDLTNISANYGGETGVSVSNGLISQTVSGSKLEIQLDMNSAELAGQLKRYFPEASVNGDILSFALSPPTASVLHQDKIQRYQDDTGLGRNTLNSSISFNNNDALSVGHLESKEAAFSSYVTELQRHDDLTVEEKLTIGANSISSVGASTIIDADNSYFSGDITANKNIVGNNSSISGINNFTAENVESDTLLASQANIQSLKGDSLGFTNADINSTRSLTSSGNTFQSQNVQAPSVNSNNVNSNVSAANGFVNNMTFGQGTGETAQYTTTQVGILTSSVSQVGDASGSTATMTGQVVGGSFIGRDASFSTVNVNGDFNGGNFQGGDFSTGSDSVNSNTELIANNTIAISDNTNNINNNTTQVELNDSATNTNETNAANNGRLSESNRTSITNNANKLSSNSNRISTERNKLDVITGQLVNCMEVSQFCYPQDPSVSLSCSGCVESGNQSNFNATVSASIVNCRQGCSYEWSSTGSGFTLSNCATGNIASGGTGSASCNVSSVLENQERAVGSVSLTVTNRHYTARNDSDSVNISYENTQAAYNLATEVAGACGNIFGGGGGVYTSCSKQEASGTTGTLSIFPTISTLTDDRWGETDCPTCTWSYVVSSISCPSDPSPLVSRITSSNLGTGINLRATVSRAGSCVANMDVTISGGGQTTTYGVRLTLSAQSR